MLSPPGEETGGRHASEPVLFLGGPILGPQHQFAGLLAALGGRVGALCKEYEVHREGGPPGGYGIATEVEGIARAADAKGWDAFHIVGYSAGASLALAFAAAHPERVKSLALIEPGEIGRGRLGLQDPEFGDWEKTMALPPDEAIRVFASQVLAPGAGMPPAPAGAAPPWTNRPKAALIAFGQASIDHEVDESCLETLKAPVYIALGAASHPRFARLAGILGEILPNLTVETYEGSHHLRPPFQVHPERFATALQVLWGKG